MKKQTSIGDLFSIRFMITLTFNELYSLLPIFAYLSFHYFSKALYLFAIKFPNPLQCTAGIPFN
ncbi:phosphohydrolase [Oceanobacillus picturae]|uniref:Phosphohydrolase n=1 Tax=Oceanobacillus picturae TaxID=171693 RepID=A0A0U9HC43_9BACI|nr:phosphohydrolase [Oceanobacillus picturae]